jgi:AcrR family transcriptional regulator
MLVERKETAVARRSELLNIAADMFAATGYHATSMRELARRLKIKSGSLYYHFASKEHLLIEICSIGMNELVSHVEHAIGSEETLAGKVRAIVRGHVAVIHDFGSYLRAYQNEEPNLPAESREAIRLQLALFHHRIDELFSDASARGELRSSIRVKGARQALIAVLSELTRTQAEHPLSDLGDRGEEMTEILLYGLGA